MAVTIELKRDGNSDPKTYPMSEMGYGTFAIEANLGEACLSRV